MESSNGHSSVGEAVQNEVPVEQRGVSGSIANENTQDSQKGEHHLAHCGETFEYLNNSKMKDTMAGGTMASTDHGKANIDFNFNTSSNAPQNNRCLPMVLSNSNMSPTNSMSNMNALSPRNMNTMSPTNMNTMSPTNMNTMSPTNMNPMSSSNSMSPTNMNSSANNTADMRNMSPPLRQISPSQNTYAEGSTNLSPTNAMSSGTMASGNMLSNQMSMHSAQVSQMSQSENMVSPRNSQMYSPMHNTGQISSSHHDKVTQHSAMVGTMSPRNGQISPVNQMGMHMMGNPHVGQMSNGAQSPNNKMSPSRTTSIIQSNTMNNMAPCNIDPNLSASCNTNQTESVKPEGLGNNDLNGKEAAKLGTEFMNPMDPLLKMCPPVNKVNEMMMNNNAMYQGMMCQMNPQMNAKSLLMKSAAGMNPMAMNISGDMSMPHRANDGCYPLMMNGMENPSNDANLAFRQNAPLDEFQCFSLQALSAAAADNAQPGEENNLNDPNITDPVMVMPGLGNVDLANCGNDFMLAPGAFNELLSEAMQQQQVQRLMAGLSTQELCHIAAAAAQASSDFAQSGGTMAQSFNTLPAEHQELLDVRLKAIGSYLQDLEGGSGAAAGGIYSGAWVPDFVAQQRVPQAADALLHSTLYEWMVNSGEQNLMQISPEQANQNAALLAAAHQMPTPSHCGIPNYTTLHSHLPHQQYVLHDPNGLLTPKDNTFLRQNDPQMGAAPSAATSGAKRPRGRPRKHSILGESPNPSGNGMKTEGGNNGMGGNGMYGKDEKWLDQVGMIQNQQNNSVNGSSLPVTQTKRLRRNGSNNPESGFPGVSWNSRMQAWLAFFVDAEGTRRSHTFKCNKFGGVERARVEAIEWLIRKRGEIQAITEQARNNMQQQKQRLVEAIET